jgi:phosphoribosyl 1,2-cyclic phosphodiesterase
MSPPLFPVSLRDLPCKLTLHDIGRSSFEIGPVSVLSDLVCHPGPTAGYRITENGRALTYLPDHEPALAADRYPPEPDWLSGYALAENTDLLLHDAQYAADEYIEHIGWGHSSLPQALQFAATARAKRMVTFHHDPAHDDATLDRLFREVPSKCGVEIAAGTEGAVFDV